jgi:hypothetical protein
MKNKRENFRYGVAPCRHPEAGGGFSVPRVRETEVAIQPSRAASRHRRHDPQASD